MLASSRGSDPRHVGSIPTSSAMKTCTTCKTSKPLSEFNRKRSSYQATCRSCNSEYLKQHYQDNKEYYKDKQKRTKDRIMELFIKYMADKSCVDCGEGDSLVLQFDHLRNKTMNIAKCVHNSWSWDRILGEMSKCEIVCANCHTRRTAKRAGWKKLSGIV